MTSVIAVVRKGGDDAIRKLAEIGIGGLYQGALGLVRLAQRGEKLILGRPHDAAHRLHVLFKRSGHLDHQAGQNHFENDGAGFEQFDPVLHGLPSVKLLLCKASTAALESQGHA